MNDNETIFGDGETVELLAGQPELLAIADAVRATQRKETRKRGSALRLLLAAAVVAGLAAAGTFALAGAFGGHVTGDAALSARTPLHLVSAVGGQRVRGAVFAPCPQGPTVASGPTGPNGPTGASGCEWGYHGLNLDAFRGLAGLGFHFTITRTDGAISLVAATVVGSPRAGRTVRLRVWRDRLVKDEYKLVQVVFSEPVPLSTDELLASDIPGTTERPEWSDSFSPAAWTGGCQDAPYQLEVLVSWKNGSESAYTDLFDCQRPALGQSGPTGASGPTGGAGPTG